MGRDWAPYEHYLSEQRQIQMGYGDLFDFLENLKIEYNGKEEMCCSPEEIAIRRQFPQLGRLLMNHEFMVLYEKLSKIEGGLELLHKRDDELAAFLKAGKVVELKPNHSVLRVDDIGIDKDSYLIKWFAGTLDENFYYADRNNQLFVEEMVKDAKWKIWFESFDNAGHKIGGGVLSEEYTRKSSALRRVKQLDQKNHRWTVSRTNPYVQKNIKTGEKGSLENKIQAAEDKSKAGSSSKGFNKEVAKER